MLGSGGGLAKLVNEIMEERKTEEPGTRSAGLHRL